MARDFPHISDTTFPGVNTVNPYSFRNEFDYTRWQAGTKIKVCNVNWCGDYDNVVKFYNDTERDQYFDTIQGPTHVLDSAMRVLPNTTIKLPIPFDELVKYNYIVVDFSTATSDDNPLPYSAGSSKFFYFLRNVSYSAPSTSECQVELDVWTTYINKIEINYMVLERGHAPLRAMPADEYLANPIEGNRYLLADDVSFGEPAIIKNNDFVPFGSGKKYVLVATTAQLDGDLGHIDAVSPSDPGFYSTGARNGFEAGVTGAEIAAGGVDYSGLNLPTSASPNVYAIDASSFAEFIAALEVEAPQVIPTIMAVYIVDASMVLLTDEFTIAHRNSMTWQQLANTGLTWQQLVDSGHTYAEIDANANDYFGNGGGFTMFHVKPNDGLVKQLKLTKADFGYPEEYADIAKLYTWPYAAIEVTDADGNSSTIKVEDTGILELNQRVSLVYPYLDYSAFLTGVGGNNATEYTWRRIDGSETRKTLPSGDFMDYMFSYEIPTYQLYQNGYDNYRMRNYNANNVVPRTQKLQGYTNAARSANTAYENAVDSADKSLTNTDASINKDLGNARRSALAAYRNALDTNVTGQSNTNASAATGLSNTLNSNASANANAHASADTSKTNGDASARVSASNTENSARVSNTNTVADITTGTMNLQAQCNLNDVNTHNRNLVLTQDAAAAPYSAAFSAALNAQAATATAYNASIIGATTNEYNYSFNKTPAVTAGLTSAVSASIDVARQASDISFAMPHQTVNPVSMQPQSGLLSGGMESSVGSTNMGSALSIAGTAISTATTFGLNVTMADTRHNLDSANLGNSIKGQSVNAGWQYNSADYSADVASEVTKAQIENAKALNLASTEASNNTALNNNKRSAATGVYNANRTRDATLDNNAATLSNALQSNARSYATSNANADRTKTTGDVNAQASYSNSVANAQRSRNTADTNAGRSYDTALANADANASLTRSNAYRDAALSKANAGYSRDTALENAQTALSNDFEAIRQGYLDHRLDQPLKVTDAGGDALPDIYEWRGIQIKVKTQKEGEIAPAGDLMLRYGYMLNQVWDFNYFKSFHVMVHFSYWKCSDVWLTGGNGVIENAQETIKNILKRGTTVWRKPEEIGKISIYENMRAFG